MSRALPLFRVFSSILLQALVSVSPSSVPSLSTPTPIRRGRPFAPSWCLVRSHRFSPMCERRVFQLPLFLGNPNAWHIPSMCTSEMNWVGKKWSSGCWEAGVQTRSISFFFCTYLAPGLASSPALRSSALAVDSALCFKIYTLAEAMAQSLRALSVLPQDASLVFSACTGLTHNHL